MPQENTGRVQHLIDERPNSFRDDELDQIINDLDEDLNSVGFTQVIRSTFIDKIILWDDNPSSNPNAKKRMETTYNRVTSPFVSSIVREVYNQEGSAVVATVTYTYTRTGDNKISSQQVTVTRP